MTTETNVKEVIAETLGGVSAEQLSAESNMDNVPNWDSMNFLTVVLALEKKFGIRFSPAEVAKMYNIGKIVELIDSKANA